MTLRSDDDQSATGQDVRVGSLAARQQNHMAARPSVRPVSVDRNTPPSNICNFTGGRVGGAREGSAAAPVICVRWRDASHHDARGFADLRDVNCRPRLAQQTDRRHRPDQARADQATGTTPPYQRGLHRRTAVAARAHSCFPVSATECHVIITRVNVIY